MPTPQLRASCPDGHDDSTYESYRSAVPQGRSRHRRWGLLLVVVGVLMVAGTAAPEAVALLSGSGSALDNRFSLHAGATRAAVDMPSTAASGTFLSTSAPDPTADQPVLRLAGLVPSSGKGAFRYASGYGKVLGRSGPLRRYRVAVEVGAGEDVADFAVAVDRALADPRSWIASGRLRLQRVPSGVGHAFTIRLVTANTARRMCAAGWVDIRVGGKPYTSCRAGANVIINLDRWRLSVDDYVSAGVPLSVYRTYVINHEVGHALGHQHERCPGKGRPAPVMQTQTLGLKGCLAYPWPYLNGERYAGAPAGA